MKLEKIGLGGGCHWCTEAVFDALRGVTTVEQGYISSFDEFVVYSEAVIVHYDPEIIRLQDLIEIHLHTHKSTSNHSFRKKYRSAVYYFEASKKEEIQNIIKDLQSDFELPIITLVLPFNNFVSSSEEFVQYYSKNPEKPFCKRYIHPKLELLRKKYTNSMISD
ncbi:peptide-methionine (S)-S-oxide reductase [Aquimarina spongiae]|uniref:peptide-methionine (S)-S-oxide reductase n=1 Tax=Aquimarina spongiae TaxID=570521 RepID=A0A1M6HH47_9FLAO|nr:peptide-methionine (S)-S-oxide reductase [Aquimarina spongiae]SHJ21540.1 peptide-methionine (S)-S-oxide reductase [Aquimarina spongiae]